MALHALCMFCFVNKKCGIHKVPELLLEDGTGTSIQWKTALETLRVGSSLMISPKESLKDLLEQILKE